ncbi:hypothetical protein [Nonomuraea sp. NPDC050643]|uniref:hypothetical protein n=1 Tax=Nonomuraea sp. NPDC050643 TaxID=3155660 RepID=UPI0033D37BBE
MSDLPEEAVQAAAEVLYREYDSEFGADHLSWRDFTSTARAALVAAAPVIAAQARAEALRDVIAGEVTLDEQAAAQGVTGPQRIEDLHTDLDFTPEEVEGFFAAIKDEPFLPEEGIRADERRKVAEEQHTAGMVVVSADDLDDAIDALCEREDVCFGEDCSVVHCQRVNRLRAALPERTEGA